MMFEDIYKKRCGRSEYNNSDIQNAIIELEGCEIGAQDGKEYTYTYFIQIDKRGNILDPCQHQNGMVFYSTMKCEKYDTNNGNVFDCEAFFTAVDILTEQINAFLKEIDGDSLMTRITKALKNVKISQIKKIETAYSLSKKFYKELNIENDDVYDMYKGIAEGYLTALMDMKVISKDDIDLIETYFELKARGELPSVLRCDFEEEMK